MLFCVHAFQQRPDINIADLKAQAEMHGLKVSVGSWVAARQLLAPPAVIVERLALGPEPTATPDDPATATPSSQAVPIDAHEPAQVAEPALHVDPPTEPPPRAITVDDAERPIGRMVRLFVAEVQAAGDAKAERLRTVNPRGPGRDRGSAQRVDGGPAHCTAPSTPANTPCTGLAADDSAGMPRLRAAVEHAHHQAVPSRKRLVTEFLIPR